MNSKTYTRELRKACVEAVFDDFSVIDAIVKEAQK